MSPDGEPQSHVSFFLTFFKLKGTSKGLCVRDVIPEVHRPIRLQRSRSGCFYLEVRVAKQLEIPSPAQVCALDPGGHHFVTFYDPAGRAIAIDDFQVKKSRRAIDRAEAARPSRNKRERYRAGVMIRVTNVRMAQREEAMQLRLASWLAANYSKVLLPRVHLNQMQDQWNFGAGKSLASSHHRFRFLLEQRLARMGGVLLDCSEEYTTQACSRCGATTETSCTAVFKCPDFRLTIDRDVNAAGNIFLINEELIRDYLQRCRVTPHMI